MARVAMLLVSTCRHKNAADVNRQLGLVNKILTLSVNSPEVAGVHEDPRTKQKKMDNQKPSNSLVQSTFLHAFNCLTKNVEHEDI